MDYRMLVTEPVQLHIRSIINRHIIQKGLTLLEIAEQANIGYSSIRHFMDRNKPVGLQTTVRISHWLITEGYTIEDLTPQKIEMVK